MVEDFDRLIAALRACNDPLDFALAVHRSSQFLVALQVVAESFGEPVPPKLEPAADALRSWAIALMTRVRPVGP